MTQLEILRLAYHAQIERWNKIAKKVIKKPENKLTKRKEQKAWEKVEEIRELIRQEEQ